MVETYQVPAHLRRSLRLQHHQAFLADHPKRRYIGDAFYDRHYDTHTFYDQPLRSTFSPYNRHNCAFLDNCTQPQRAIDPTFLAQQRCALVVCLCKYGLRRSFLRPKERRTRIYRSRHPSIPESYTLDLSHHPKASFRAPYDILSWVLSQQHTTAISYRIDDTRGIISP